MAIPILDLEFLPNLHTHKPCPTVFQGMVVDFGWPLLYRVTWTSLAKLPGQNHLLGHGWCHHSLKEKDIKMMKYMAPENGLLEMEIPI